MSGRVEASIVIRAFNEEKHLPSLLEAIRAQDHPSFEVVVVDSGSYDRSQAIAEEFGARLIRIDSRDFTFGYSLNVGIREARGSKIAIVSAHTRPIGKSWLSKLVAPLEDEKTAMVYGRQAGTKESKYSEIQDFKRTFGERRLTMRPPNFFANNANSAVSKELWERRPFDPALPGLEDIDWAKYWMEQGREVVYEPEAGIYHIHEETWRQVRRRYSREGMAAKWIGVRGRRDIPFELARECSWLVQDFALAAMDGRLTELAGEIARFRFFKALGTVEGLARGAALGDPRKKDSLFFDRAQKAVVIDGPGSASLQEVPLPAVKPGDVMIKVAYTGVCATDVEILDGALDYFKTGLSTYPITPGHEFSGVVVKLGENVAHLKEGDAVVAECIQSCQTCDACKRANWIGCASRTELGVMRRDGAYAEYVVVPGVFAHKLAKDTDLKLAALCEPIAVALKGIGRLRKAAGSLEGKRCGVVGAGPIGRICAQVLAHQGARVTVFDRNPARLKRLGANIAASHELSKLRDCDAVIEATGNQDALEGALSHSAPGAVLLLLGLPYETREFSFEKVVAFDKVVVGSVGSSAHDFKQAIALLPHLDLAPLCENAYPLHEFEKAWAACREGKHLKTLLEVDPLLARIDGLAHREPERAPAAGSTRP